MLDQYQKEILWRNFEEEAKSIFMLPKLSDEEIEYGTDEHGNVQSSYLACVSMDAILAFLRLLRHEFERTTPFQQDASQFDTLEYWKNLNDCGHC